MLSYICMTTYNIIYLSTPDNRSTPSEYNQGVGIYYKRSMVNTNVLEKETHILGQYS